MFQIEFRRLKDFRPIDFVSIVSALVAGLAIYFCLLTVLLVRVLHTKAQTLLLLGEWGHWGTLLKDTHTITKGGIP